MQIQYNIVLSCTLVARYGYCNLNIEILASIKKRTKRELLNLFFNLQKKGPPEEEEEQN
jgi:hypothetical protein